MGKDGHKDSKPEAYVKQEFSLLPKILNGGIAGMVSYAVVFPLDLVKTRLQNQPVGPKGEKQYKNIFDCFRKVIRAEGLIGMYRGSAIVITLVTPEKAVKLSANDLFRHHFELPDGSLPLIRQMVAGGLAGGCQACITNPMELLKIQMQDAGRVAAIAKAEGKAIAERPTARKVAAKLFKERGVFGLYKGFPPCLGRDILFSVVYFPLFAALNKVGTKLTAGKTKRPDDPSEAPFWVSFISGCISGSLSALVVTPFDVVKTRMQTLTRAQSERKYKSITDCAVQTLKHEGPFAFFKGGACRMIVIAPIYGIAQVVYFLGIAEFLFGL